MPYITVMQTQRNHQVSFEDILFDRVPFFNNNPVFKNGGTVTFLVEKEDTIEKYRKRVNVQQLIKLLEAFNAAHEYLFNAERRSLYHTFYIPKRSGGYRKIDEPLPDLMSALRQLKTIFEAHFGALHHTSAFAYVKGRSAVDSVKKHQMNKSRWFLKTDFSNFFGNTNEDFVWQMITKIFPFSEVVKSASGSNALRKALSLCFLDGGLPQGTPISPLLTNIVMVPIDHRLTNDLVKKGYVYSRYADDILISHRESFEYKDVCSYMSDILKMFGAPFALKPEKTRYGSSAGRNWNLGVMLNKENKITIGRKNKEYLKAACNSYVIDKRNKTPWDVHDILVLRGKISYYKMVEPDYIEQFIRWFNEKNNVNLLKMLREDLQ